MFTPGCMVHDPVRTLPPEKVGRIFLADISRHFRSFPFGNFHNIILSSTDNRKRHQERLAQLSSGVATIHAGGRTQTELWERKLRLEDAVHAAQAAQLEGVVPGGGTALVRLIPTIKSCAGALRGDEKTGALAVIHALEAPARQIAKNAGRDGSTIAAKLRGLPEAIGYDAGADRFTDMVQAGILDPMRVTRTALQSALSVSASMLTTEACITGNDQSTEA